LFPVFLTNTFSFAPSSFSSGAQTCEVAALETGLRRSGQVGLAGLYWMRVANAPLVVRPVPPRLTVSPNPEASGALHEHVPGLMSATASDCSTYIYE
jgi:hypothetical protein